MKRPLAAAGLASLLLHGAILWTLLPRGSARTQQALVTPPELAVEFVDQSAEEQGASAAAAGSPPPTAEAPPVQADAGAEALPPPAAASPQRPTPPGPTSAVKVNLSGGEEDRESLLVTGDNVVPPRPDETIRNRPPAYPAAAARRHAQGTVGLVVHVTETGVAGWVDVVATSGDAALDMAAREAVALWRFRPATEGGLPVPFDFAYNIRFTLDGDRRGINGQDRPRYDQGR